MWQQKLCCTLQWFNFDVDLWTTQCGVWISDILLSIKYIEKCKLISAKTDLNTTTPDNYLFTYPAVTEQYFLSFCHVFLLCFSIHQLKSISGSAAAKWHYSKATNMYWMFRVNTWGLAGGIRLHMPSVLRMSQDFLGGAGTGDCKGWLWQECPLSLLSLLLDPR